jgi:dolichol-phosphate mannosyltransferase
MRSTGPVIFYVPVYNQAGELPALLRDFAAAKLAGVELLLINNGSSDGSAELIHASGHPYIDVPKNRGVGYACMIATDWALERGYDVFGAMAANGKMLPAEIPRLLQALDEGADYVTGSRFLPQGDSPNLPAFRRQAIPWVNRFVRVAVGASLTDATCGFRAFRLELMRRAQFDWHAPWLHTYGFEYYVYAKVLLDRTVQWREAPVTMRYPAQGRYTKIRAVRDWYAMLQPWVRARLDPAGFAPRAT